MSGAPLIHRVLRAVLLSGDVYAEDNVDEWYPPYGFQADASEVVNERAEYFRFFLDNAASFDRFMSRLKDAESRDLLFSLLLFRILGYRRVRIHFDRDAFEAARALAMAIPGNPSVLCIPGAPGLSHFEVTAEGKTLLIDCLRANLFYSLFLKQYYFSRGEAHVSPSQGDVVVDAGACFGDTAIGFAASAGCEGHVFAMEILSSHLEIIRHNCAQNNSLNNVTVCPFALGERDQEGDIVSGAPDPGYSLIGAIDGVAVRSLDSLVEDGTIPRVDFLKMDIEGFELPALRGASQTIRRFRPKLAISIYHKPSDYFAIPEFIESLYSGYDMYLENYTISDGETILYAARPAAPV